MMRAKFADGATARLSGDHLAGLKAAHNAFYRGDIAGAIARFHAKNGSFLSADDLAGFSVDVEPALSVAFRRVSGLWCQDPLLGDILLIPEDFEVAGIGHDAPIYIHHLVKAVKHFYSDNHFSGVQKFMVVPKGMLLSRDYTAVCPSQIDPARACPRMPPAGVQRAMRDLEARAYEQDASQLDTSYICVVARKGNAFCAISSDAPVNSPVIPGLGCVRATCGAQWWTDPRVRAVLASGKRPRLTPNLAIAPKAGQWDMPFGSPGNGMQPRAMPQVLLNILVWGMPLKETADRLLAIGHDVRPWDDWDWASGALGLHPNRGIVEGASDPRRPTGVAGW